MNKLPAEFKILRYSKFRKLIEFICRQRNVVVNDHLEGQLSELYKFYYPSAPDDLERFQLFKWRYLEGHKLKEVGSWVWYPWLRHLVHLLSPEDFYRIRTSRNRFLVTDSEQDRFRKICVAVAGISVGSSLATALHLQGGAQYIKLADFDVLELSNTNRIPIGIVNLGEQKIELVKRRLLEIDPYAKMSLFSRGLNSRNVEAFCSGANIIFDEVDNLQIKVLLRQYARKFRIPLIMLTDNDDGVLVDYYPYHKNKRVPLFHGLADRKILEIVNSKKMPSKEDIVRLSSKIVGRKNISTRMTKSLKSISKTLVSWPQLGTAALLAGTVGAYMARMIANGYNFRFRRRLIRLNDQLT